MESIVVGLIGTRLPFLSLKDSNTPVDVDWLPKVFRPDSEPSTSCEGLEPTRLERLKEEFCEVVTMAAQSEESGRRSATIVMAKVPASGKSWKLKCWRMAKTEGMTIVQPLMTRRICMGFKFVHPIFFRVMTVQKSFHVKMREKNQIETVSVNRVPVRIHF